MRLTLWFHSFGVGSRSSFPTSPHGFSAQWENLGCFPDPWGSDSCDSGVQGEGVAFPEAMALETAPILADIVCDLTVSPRATSTHSGPCGDDVCYGSCTKPQIANWRPTGWVLLIGVSCSLNTRPRACPCFPQLPSRSSPTLALTSS